jgi:hypothetical protein
MKKNLSRVAFVDFINSWRQRRRRRRKPTIDDLTEMRLADIGDAVTGKINIGNGWRDAKTDPPLPEDFQPAGYIRAFVTGGERGPYIGQMAFSHWRGQTSHGFWNKSDPGLKPAWKSYTLECEKPHHERPRQE